MTSPKTRDQKLDDFVGAIADGAQVYAHPVTAEQMNSHPEINFPVHPRQWLEEGRLIAMSEPELFEHIPVGGFRIE